MSLEFVHGDLYSTALEITRKWVSKSNSRPVLTYAQHREGGEIVATDSHRLIRIKDIHGFKEEYLVDPKHFHFAKGNYPDIDRLIPENNVKTIVLSKEQIQLWLQLFRSMNQTLRVMKDRLGVVEMQFKENHIEMVLPEHEVSIKLPHNEYLKPEEMTVIHFGAEYMRDALEAHFKMNSEQLTFYFGGPMRPFFMNDDSMVTTLILPVRRG